jgi:hypothetical protein
MMMTTAVQPMEMPITAATVKKLSKRRKSKK